RCAGREDAHACRARGRAVAASDNDSRRARHLAAGHPADDPKADLREVLAGEETRGRICARPEYATAVLPAVRPLAQRAQLTERAGHARGLLPLALVGKAIDAAGSDREPAAVRDRVRPGHAIERAIRRALFLLPLRRGTVSGSIDEHRVLSDRHGAAGNGKNIYVLGPRWIAEQRVPRGNNDDLGLDHRG